MMANKKNFFQREYNLCWDYLKSIKKYIYFSIGVFVFFSFVGFFIPLPKIFYEKILETLMEILLKTEGLGTFGMINFIFFNNVQVSFLVFVFGIFFGILPFFSAIFNGLVLGIVGFMSVEIGGFLTLWKILPHGIFELPAVFISLGMGLKLGLWWIIEPVPKVKKKNYFWKIILNSIKVFILVVVPLLLIGAIIEGYLISLFLG
jgi:stage II sporulation protein M